jgi:hypothetical protein
MRDTRLLGVWRSDARRTGREIEARNDIPPPRAKKLKKLFGKLEIRFTSTHCYSTLDGFTEVRRYKVLAKDHASVAILGANTLDGESTISHIHFEGKHFWVTIGNGLLREFFKRIPSR